MTSKKPNYQPGFATRAIHLGYDPADANRALTPPIYMTSTYAFESAEEGTELFAGEREGYVYGRARNPTQTILEERLASLEGGEAAVAFGSGMGAITSTVWSCTKAGDDIVIDHTLYGCTFAFFAHGLTKYGVNVRYADLTRPETLEAVITRNTRLVFFETPANPNLRVIDISRIAAIGHRVGAMVIVDNTFCSPVLQRPLEHGADVVVHSATKFLGGHGDLIAGVAIGSADIMDQARQGLRLLTGSSISPLTAFLVLRGLKTLELRMERHCENAQAIAELLDGHPAIDRVFYPGLASFPQRDLVKRQMQAPGSLIALELRGGIENGRKFMNALNLSPEPSASVTPKP